MLSRNLQIVVGFLSLTFPIRAALCISLTSDFQQTMASPRCVRNGDNTDLTVYSGVRIVDGTPQLSRVLKHAQEVNDWHP